MTEAAALRVSRLRGLLLNLLLAAGTTVLFVMLLEGGARVLERRRPQAPQVADYLWNWEKKWDGDFYTLESEAVGWPEYEEINADGVRDRTHAVEKPEGTVRLLFLGDSVTLGAGIEPRDAFPQRVQARYDEEGAPVEVFNLGLWGWSTRQERIAWERIGRRYRPDHVVLGVCLNDIPELQNNLARPAPWLTALHERSAVVRLAVNAPGREIASVEELFTQQDSPKVRAAFDKFFQEVLALRQAVEKEGASFAVVVFPFRFQEAPGAPAPVVQEKLGAFFREQNIPAFDFLPVLRPAGESVFWDYDHFSEKGADLVARTLLESRLWPAVPGARERLQQALGPRGGEVKALAGLLGHQDPALRRAAAWGLGRQGAAAAAAVPALRTATRDASEAVRAQAAAALGAVGAPAAEAIPDLFLNLQDARESVRWAAARALARLPLSAREHLQPLMAAVRSDDAFVRAFACWSLGNLGPAASEAVPVLLEALPRRGGFARAGAVGALAKIGAAAEAAVPTLVKALDDPNGDHRWQAARALGRIGPPARQAVPALARALSDANEHVRVHAARALGRIGPDARTAAPALTAATGDPDPAVRKEAAEALARLRG